MDGQSLANGKMCQLELALGLTVMMLMNHVCEDNSHRMGGYSG